MHSLLGVALGLPLYIVFLAGSLAFYNDESVLLTHPQFSQQGHNGVIDWDGMVERMHAKYGELGRMTVRMPSPERPLADIYYESSDGDQMHHDWLIPGSNELVPAPDHDIDFAHFVVDLHFLEILPFGRYISGVIAALFCALIITGLVYQWRDMKKDFSRRVFSKLGRQFWRQWHRTLSVVTMPFQFCYAVTGAAFGLGLLAIAPVILLEFENDQSELEKAIDPTSALVSRGKAKEFRLAEAIQKARAEWNGDVSFFLVQVVSRREGDRDDCRKILVMEGREKGVHFLRKHQLAYTMDGCLLQRVLPGDYLGQAALEGLVNLHFGIFGSPWIKLAFALVGLIVTFSIAAGILILVRRYDRACKHRWDQYLLRWVSYSTIYGVFAGLIMGILMCRIHYPAAVQSFWITLSFTCLVVAVELARRSRCQRRSMAF